MEVSNFEVPFKFCYFSSVKQLSNNYIITELEKNFFISWIIQILCSLLALNLSGCIMGRNTIGITIMTRTMLLIVISVSISVRVNLLTEHKWKQKDKASIILRIILDNIRGISASFLTLDQRSQIRYPAWSFFKNY